MLLYYKMPEGPEIKYLELLLNDLVYNKTFLNITSNTKTIKNIPSKSKVIDTGSKGKVLWLQTKHYYVHIRMGLTGWIVDQEPKIYKYILHFNGINLWLKDRRRFSSINIFLTKEDHIKELDKLGIDILTKDFTLDIFKEKVSNSKRNISALLLDQKIFSGIGNYIRNDVLYIAKILPQRNSKTLTNKEIEDLYNAIRFVSYSNIIDWLRSNSLKIPKEIKNSKPKNLLVPYEMFVYGKDKDKFNNKIKYDKSIAGRKTYYVTNIQK